MEVIVVAYLKVTLFSFCHYCNHFNVVVFVGIVGGGDGGV